MPPTPKELRENRQSLVAKARGLLDAAEKSNRSLTADEETQYQAIDADIVKLTSQITEAERALDRRSRLSSLEAEADASRGRRTDPETPDDEARGNAPRRPGDENRDRNADAVIERRGKKYRFKSGTAEHRRATPEYRAAFNAWLENRALQTDLDVSGGFLTAPEQFVAELLKDVDDTVDIRKLARIFVSVNAQTLGVARRTSKLQSFAWGTELSTPKQDTALKFGKRALTPHYMTGEILVSKDLMRASVMDPEQIVREELARDAGELEEQGFMTGSGAQQPLGLFTASTDGISTSRDVSSGNDATAVKFDGLINALGALKAKYLARARWLFHRDVLTQIRKLKDGEGQYLWQPSVQMGQPDMILNKPYTQSEWAPNTLTTGKYVGLIGDFQYYWIADALTLELQQLVEKYAESNQVAFLARRKVDGAPMLEEAFARVKLG